jgi:hypothetical protein
MGTVLVVRKAVKGALEVLRWSVIRGVAPPVWNQCAEKHEKPDWPLERDERDDHSGQRMTDQHEVRGRGQRPCDRRRVVSERRGALI